MTPHAESLKHIAALKTFEMQRHRRSMEVLTQIETLLKTYVSDLASAAEAGIQIEFLREATRPASADSKPTGRSGIKIETVPGGPTMPTGEGLSDAIRAAIRSFGDDVFSTHQVCEFLRNHYPNLKTDTSTVSKRLYQMRKAGQIEIVPGSKAGRGKGGQIYRIAKSPKS